MAAEVASTFEIGPEVAEERAEVLRCGSWLRGDLVNQTIFFQKSLPLPNTSRQLSKMSSACKSSFKRISVLGFRIRAGFIHRPEITISNSAYYWQALLWEVRCPGLSSPARWRLTRLPQFDEKRQCFHRFEGVFSHYIFFWIIFEGSLRRSFSSRICWWSVGLEMQRVRISGPVRVGSTTSIERMSESSASTRCGSLPSPALSHS